MNETHMIIYMLACAGLFAAGGTWKKSLRRFGLPIVTFLFLIVHATGWQAWGIAIISSVLLGASLHLGYGETKPLWYKFLVGCSYAIPSMLIGLTFWQPVLPICFISLFILSNWQITSKDVPWKLWECFMGMLISFTYIGALNRAW